MRDITEGDLVIVNDIDQPCPQLIAEVRESYKDHLICDYIDVNVKKPRGLHVMREEARLVSDFGVVLINSEMFGSILVKQVKASEVTYRKEPQRLRPWQGRGSNYIHLSEDMTLFKSSYLLRYFWNHFSCYENPQSFHNYILPYFNNIATGSFDTLQDAYKYASTVKRWCDKDEPKRT